jgi:hypothetical protein
MHSFKTLWFKIIFIFPPIFPDAKHLRTQWTEQAIDWLPDWLIMMGWDYVSELRPPTGLLFNPRVMWAWRAMVMMMPAGDNSWLVHQSSLAVLPAETSGASRMNGRRSENFAYQYPEYLKGYLTYRKILGHGASSFTYHPKEGVLRIFIALKNPSPRPGMNPRPLGSVECMLITTPPRPLDTRGGGPDFGTM